MHVYVEVDSVLNKHTAKLSAAKNAYFKIGMINCFFHGAKIDVLRNERLRFLALANFVPLPPNLSLNAC